MEEKKSEMQQPTAADYPSPYGYYPAEDEISLVDLWRVLVRRKMIIMGLTAIVTIGAVLYALLATPVYKIEATFLPPTASDIQALNIPEFHRILEVTNNTPVLKMTASIMDATDFHSIGVNSVYALFEKNLRIRSSRKSIFEKMKLVDRSVDTGGQEVNATEIFEEFNQGITVAISKKQSGQQSIQPITLSMEGDDPVLIVEIVNRLGKEAERAATEEIIINIQAKVSARKKELEHAIELLRGIAKVRRLDAIESLEATYTLESTLIREKITSLRNKMQNERQDRISRLQEAAKIARSLDMADSQAPTNISGSASPLYTLGYKALEAEVVVLSNRKVDDPFIPGIRELQEKLKLLENNQEVYLLKKGSNDDSYMFRLRDKEYELAWLETIDIDPLLVKTARLDQAAYAREKRIKPNRKLIVVLGLMLGLMLGVFAAFFVNFIANQKAETAEA